MKKDQRKKSNNIIQLPPRKKKLWDPFPKLLHSRKTTMGFLNKKPSAVGISDSFRFKIGPLFRGAFRFFPATGILPNPSVTSWTLWRARSRRLACIFATKGILGRKFPWEMWVEKVNIDIADIHNLATYLYDLFLNTTATECRVYLPTMKG